MPGSRTYQTTERFTRGDQYVQRFTLIRAGFDFSGTTVTAQVRAKPGGPLLATPSVALSAAEVGRATGSITMAGAVTEGLPGKCVLEMQVEDSDAGFGPHTPVRVYLEIDADITQP